MSLGEEDLRESGFNLIKSCIKTVAKGKWVCWRNFIAAPLTISLTSFHIFYKGHFE